MKNVLRVDDVKKFFDETSNYYDDSRNVYLQEQRAKILKREVVGPNILDIGINAGNLVAKYYDSQSENNLFGIDLSLNCVKKASLQIPSGRFFCADGQHLCFQNDIFQTVISVESIYYMENALRCLAEIYRCLSNNGKVIVISSSSLMTRVAQLIAVPFKLRHSDIANITFSAHHVSKLMSKAGFVNIRHKYFNVIPFRGWEFADKSVFHKFGTFSVVKGLKK